MTKLGTSSFIAGCLICLASTTCLQATDTNQTPDFAEVYGLVRAHLAGMTESELNRAAVEGLLTVLGSRVSLESNGLPAETAQVVSKTKLLDDSLVYVRVSRVADGLAQAIHDACSQLAPSNRLKGLVLDLRYAGGSSYAAAVEAANLFSKSERPLLDWGQGVVKSKATENAIEAPVALLINRQTARAAEALAGVMREMGAGLLLGNPTAGEAMIAEEFTLTNGQHLRVATQPVRLADGTSLPMQGLKPDISVEVSPQDEQAYYLDAYAILPRTNLQAVASNSPGEGSRPASQVRFNEARLVREHKDGVMAIVDQATARAEPEIPLVQDPVLARALDVLKGLAVVRQSRQSRS
jgi:hypothetical protein